MKPLGPIDTVVFDHDGTLVDSIPVVVMASNGVLRERGLPVSGAGRIVDGMVHPTALRLGHLAGVPDRPTQESMARRYNHLALEHSDRATLYPGIASMLAELEGRCEFQAVVSNSEGAFIRSILTRLDVARHFRVMLGEDDMEAPKPDPRGLLASLGDTPVHRAVFVGDSSTDLNTARAAGMRAIGVTWGTHARAEMEALGFDALVDSPQELAQLV